MSSYIGKIHAGNTDYSIGSTLLGLCSTANNTTAQSRVKLIELTDFDTPLNGVTIYVQFPQGNTYIGTNDNDQLQFHFNAMSQDAPNYDVIGDCRCEENDILGFTFKANSQTGGKWYVHTSSQIKTIKDSLANLAPIKFRGVEQTLPAISSNMAYNNGDIIVVGAQEYILIRPENEQSPSNWHWEPFGPDMSAYVLTSSQQIDSISLLSISSGATVSNGTLTLPVFESTSKNVIVPATT